MIKQMLLLSAAVTCLSGVANAADLRGPIGLPETPATYGVLPAPGFTWGGVYAGVNVGYGGGNDRYSYQTSSTYSVPNGYSPWGYGGSTQTWSDECGCTTTATTTNSGSDTHRSNGVLGGVQIGYNYAFAHNVVVGVEADFDGTGIGSDGLVKDLASSGAAAVDVSNRINYMGTVRGRLGYAFDRVLVYGTAGFAYADMTTALSAPNVGSGLSTSQSSLHTGYVYGGGFEFALTNNILFRTEYLHAEFNSKEFSRSDDPWVSYSAKIRPNVNIVRAGLDYKFDLFAPAAPVPVIARY